MIELEDVSKHYGGHAALHRTTLAFERARTTVLIGPSGCGKSTLLRLIVGLVRPDSGRVVVGGEALTEANLRRVRHAIGYVIQDGGLFPHLDARDNVVLLARHLGLGREAIEQRVGELCALTGIGPGLLERYPQELSGGQRQRIGLMRALMLDPPVLLLDEPLGALDPITRFELQTELKAIFARLAKTVVMVTHDMAEAAYFADDLVLMNAGRIVQRGTFQALADHPAEPYVTEFIRAQRPPAAAVQP